MTDKLCPVMSRPHPLGVLLEVYCRENCKARRKDGGCKLIDGKE